MKSRIWRALAAVLLLFATAGAAQAQEVAEGIAAEAPQESFSDYIRDEVMPKEGLYFTSRVGLEPRTGIPFDHVRVRLQSQKMAETGRYTAGSKLSLSVSYLVKAILQKPGYENVPLEPDAARKVLRKHLEMLQTVSRKYPDYAGFYPWLEMRKDGSLKPASEQIPSLDNGQLTWALAAVVGGLGRSTREDDQHIVRMAEKLLEAQDYGLFYSEEKGLLSGIVQLHADERHWVKDPNYHLIDMYEGTMAVLWGVLNGQVPREAWDNIDISAVDYETSSGETVTTLRGWRASFHEHWALAFLPFMESDLGKLYRNYLHVQADYAHENDLPGFLTTGYDSRGSYRQMGIKAAAWDPGDRDDVAVTYATAMGYLIDQEAGGKWFAHLYEFPGMVTEYGALESVGPDGYADIMTIDAKGLTVLALTGGVVDEIKAYLSRYRVPGTETTLYEKLIELLNYKYQQLLAKREDKPIYMPQQPIPLPSDNLMEVVIEPVTPAGESYSVSGNLQSGHLHGKNVRSVGKDSLEDDLRPNAPFTFVFATPDDLPLDDQWAFRGTYLKEGTGLQEMRYLAITIPADSPDYQYDIEIKRDDVRLITAWVSTDEEGVVSEDGQWKTLVYPVRPAPDAVWMPANYIAIAMHDPNNLKGKYAKNAREGIVVIKDIALSVEPPEGYTPDPEIQPVPAVDGDMELVQYWVPSHGDLSVNRDWKRHVVRLDGGAGWRGGPVPYMDMEGYKKMHVKARNLSGRPNHFSLEIKNDSESLFGGKRMINLPMDERWHIITLEVEDIPEGLINYLAVSDPAGPFEISSISFTD